MFAPVPTQVSPEEALCLQASRRCFDLEKKCCTFRGLNVTRLDVFRSFMLVVEYASLGAVTGAALGVVTGSIVGALAGGLAGTLAGSTAGGVASAVVVYTGAEHTALKRVGHGVLGGFIGAGTVVLQRPAVIALENALGIEGVAKGALDGVFAGAVAGSISALPAGIATVINNYFIRNRVVERSDPVVQLSNTVEPDQMLELSEVTTHTARARSTVVAIDNEAFVEDNL